MRMDSFSVVSECYAGGTILEEDVDGRPRFGLPKPRTTRATTPSPNKDDNERNDGGGLDDDVNFQGQQCVTGQMPHHREDLPTATTPMTQSPPSSTTTIDLNSALALLDNACVGVCEGRALLSDQQQHLVAPDATRYMYSGEISSASERSNSVGDVHTPSSVMSAVFSLADDEAVQLTPSGPTMPAHSRPLYGGAPLKGITLEDVVAVRRLYPGAGGGIPPTSPAASLAARFNNLCSPMGQPPLYGQPYAYLIEVTLCHGHRVKETMSISLSELSSAAVVAPPGNVGSREQQDGSANVNCLSGSSSSSTHTLSSFSPVNRILRLSESCNSLTNNTNCMMPNAVDELLSCSNNDSACATFVFGCPTPDVAEAMFRFFSDSIANSALTCLAAPHFMQHDS